MSHLDEGTLHALLDGELDVAEAREVQSHLGTCVACGSRLQEVKQFLAEADRLVGALEMPASAAAPATPPPPRQSAPFRRPQRDPESWEETPVLLLPDNSDALARRRRWFRALRWAAMIVVVVGGGRVLLNVVGPHASLPPIRDFITVAPPAAPAVASPEETGRPEEPAAKAPAPAPPARTPAQNRALAAKASPQPKAAAAEALVDSAREPADTVADAFTDTTPVEDQTLAAAGALAESVATDSVSRDTQAKDTQPKEAARQDDLATRQAASEALAELDRQRRRDRAAAATAALQRAEAPAAAAPPAPRTPEQRAQVYLRIGLDEAAKQLGRPVHVIEGLTPEFIGLTYGRLVAGADPNRPVVRVVYVDSRGRMILLDQQRMRAGQAPGGGEGSLRWVIDDVMLYLRGEPGPDVLRSLQRRVR
jgi:Putative zinc-finger